MATTTTRLALSKPASTDLVSAFQGTVSTSFNTIDANFAFNVATKVGPYTAVAGDFIKADVSGRTVTDGVTNSTAVVTSATASFVAGDVGRLITGTNIPALSYIGVVTNGTTIGLSSSPTTNTPVNATGSGSGITLVIGASWSLTLPASPFNGAQVGVKLTVAPGANTLTVVGTVDGASNPTLTSLNAVRVYVYDGTAWQVTGSGAPLGPVTVDTLTITDAKNIVLGLSTGTQIGTATTQKVAFLGSTPVVQQANSVDLGAVLSTFGFRASGGNPPLNLGTGTLTGGTITGNTAVQTVAGGCTNILGASASFAYLGTTSSQPLDLYSNSAAIARFAGGAVTINAGNVFFPCQAATGSEPAYVKGGMYFNTTLNKLRVGGATAWETVTSV